jgi:hypothetical protein
MVEHEVHVDPTNIQVIGYWTTPMTLTDLHSFLVLANLYHRFILRFSHIAWSLSQLSRGGAKDKNPYVLLKYLGSIHNHF